VNSSSQIAVAESDFGLIRRAIHVESNGSENRRNLTFSELFGAEKRNNRNVSPRCLHRGRSFGLTAVKRRFPAHAPEQRNSMPQRLCAPFLWFTPNPVRRFHLERSPNVEKERQSVSETGSTTRRSRYLGSEEDERLSRDRMDRTQCDIYFPSAKRRNVRRTAIQ